MVVYLLSGGQPRDIAKIVERDAFGASGRPATERALESCEQSLEAYAARVYAEEAEGQ